jgi:hypothetical protein
VTPSPLLRPPTLTALGLVAAGAAAALVLAGCGPDSAAGASSSGAPQANAGAGTAPQGGDRRVPGVYGLVAAIEGKTLQVQGATEQTAVTYTGSTTITAEKATSASALEVGDCVSARPAQGDASNADGTTASPSPSAATGGGLPTTVAAATVSILSSGGKGCADAVRGGVGGGGTPPFPGNGARPGAAPTGAPRAPASGAPGGARREGRRGFGGFGTIGEVTALSAGSFTVTATTPRFGGAASGATPTAGPTTTTRTVTVTYTGATTFTTTTKATAAAITVGECVRATGRADDTGAVSATSLALTPAVGGACTAVRGG